TIASAANQVFVVGQGATAIGAITVTDAATPGITAANDIRIRIPATLTMTWNTGLTAATLTGSAAGKVAPTVSYEDGGKTLVLSVTTNFAGNDQLVVSGLQYMGFTAPSAADYLQLVVSGAGGGTNASDSRTIQVVAPTIASAANQVFVVGQAATAISAITVTDAGGGTNASDSRTLQIVAPTIASAADQVFLVGQAPTAISAITITDAATPSITATKDIRIRIPATFNMTWNTALTTASITGSGNGKVSRTVSYEDGGKTLVIDVTSNFGAGDRIVVSGLQYTAFTAGSPPDYLQLVVSGAGSGTAVRDSRTIQVVAPAMASAGDQVFVVGHARAAISPITITDASPPTVTAAKDHRIRIPATFNMTWNTALTTATIMGSAAGKVSPTVSYEDGGTTLVLNVTSNFAGNDQVVISGLQYTSFTAPSAADYLQLVVGGAGGGTNASDSHTIQVVAPTISS